MDFYAVCAYYWGVSRWDAKTRIIEFFYNNAVKVSAESPYVQVNTRTLNFIPSEARAEALAFQGIILGES